MPTIISIGEILKFSELPEDGYEQAKVYIDSELIQIQDSENQVIAEFSYEELRGILAVMAAEQEKQHLFIRATTQHN